MRPASASSGSATLSDDAFLAAGVALYAGEGAKTGNKVVSSQTPTRR